MAVLDIISIISDVLVILAFIGGAVWGFYKFQKMRMSESKLEIELIPVVYNNVKSKVVDVSIRLKNIGNVAIYSKVPHNQCLLEVKAIPDGLKDSVISGNDNDLPSLFPPIEFLKDFEFWYPEEPYIIEPGVTEIVHVVFSTSYDGIVLLKASFVDKDDYLYMTKKVVDLRKATSHNNG